MDSWVFALYFIIIIEYFIFLEKRDKKIRNIKDNETYKMLPEYKMLFVIGTILFIIILIILYKYVPYFHIFVLLGIFLLLGIICIACNHNEKEIIKDMNDFSKLYKKAIIVNYDYHNIKGYGVVYRTSTGSLETVRNDNPGEYLVYPYIQQFQKGKTVNTRIFIIHDKKLFEIKRIEKNNPLSDYKIISEIKNVSDDFFKDKVFDQKANRPICNEPILKIV